jgi:anti-anti-sigma factor
VQAFSAVWGSDRVLYLIGELDLASEIDVVAALEARPGGLDELVIDLSGLTFMDSTGIRVFQDAAADPRAVRTGSPRAGPGGGRELAEGGRAHQRRPRGA